MSKIATAIVREALGPRVAAELRRTIVTGEIGAGERLIEAELADRYGVSRGPVRDAFRILQSEGLLESRRQGVVVIGIGPEDIEELYSLRAALEGLALGRLLERRESVDLTALRTVIAAMERAAEAGDPEAFSAADIDFHSAICTLSGHRRVTDVWMQYKEVMMTLLRVTIFLHDDLDMSARKHRELFDLIAGRDPARARDELEAHLSGSKARMLAVWSDAIGRRRT